MRLLALWTVAIALTVACSEAEAPPAGQSAKSAAGNKNKGPPPALVELATASTESVTEGWRFLGQVRPALSAEIAAAAAGHVLEVTVRAGDSVRKGQRLLRLDATEVSARMAAAKARLAGTGTELALAERQLARVAKLDFPTVSATEKEKFELAVQTLRAQKATQSAELRRVRVEWGHHRVRAPFGGVVSTRKVDPGAWVNVGQPVLGLVSTEKLEVHVDVSAQLGTRLAKGGRATLLGSVPGREAQALVAGVVPALDPTTGTMRVRLSPPEKRPAWLLAGMPIEVEFAVSFAEPGNAASGVNRGVTVPPDALVRGPVGVKVIKFDQGMAVPIEVRVLAQSRGKVLIRGPGLVAGDQIVVRGNERLRPRQRLRIRPTVPTVPSSSQAADKSP